MDQRGEFRFVRRLESDLQCMFSVVGAANIERDHRPSFVLKRSANCRRSLEGFKASFKCLVVSVGECRNRGSSWNVANRSVKRIASRSYEI